MRLHRLLSLVVVALAATVLPAASAVASVTSDVTIQMELSGPGGAGTTGTFAATGVLCPSGLILVENGAVVHTLTCTDDSGSFKIVFSGPFTDGFASTWRFANGTGAFAHITGGGDVISDTCTSGFPCTVDLMGVATIH